MKRFIESHLEAWQRDERRRPLLLRGARQVGKSHTIAEFGRRAFSDLVVVNFEQEPRYAGCFASLDPQEIVSALSVLARRPIAPGQTLLFLDEIQECPRAITALRYFYEQMPELHVIAAGSLLEFALASEDFRMPVGRIQFLHMRPLSFGEFLDAMGEQQAQEALAAMGPDTPPSTAVHEHLLSLAKKYLILGGMPAVLAEYLESGDLERCHQIQTNILQAFRDDFGKYASRVKHRHLQKVFYAVPAMVANKFMYARVDPELRSRELKQLLERAGIVHRVRQTSGAGLPLAAGVKERHFKTIFLDVGLMQNICGLSAELTLTDDLMQINSGAVAEQFAGQELLASGDLRQPGALYYWAREARGSSAETDYLTTCGTRVVPIEVKAGKTGAMRSMHLFLKEYSASLGIKTSAQPFDATMPIVSVPLPHWHT